MLVDPLLGARRWALGGPQPLRTKLPTWPWVGASRSVSHSLISRGPNGTTRRHQYEGFRSLLVHRYGSPSSQTPRWRKPDCQRIIPLMFPVSPLIPPPAANTLLTLLCNPRGHVFLGAEARRAGMSREHHACSGPVGGPRDRRGLVRGGPPRDGALAVGTQSRAVSPHVRIAGLPSFSVEHARPSLPYDALHCSLQSAWLRVQHTAGDGGPGPLTGWTVLKQRLSHGRGAASRASPKLGPVPHPVP